MARAIRRLGLRWITLHQTLRWSTFAKQSSSSAKTLKLATAPKERFPGGSNKGWAACSELRFRGISGVDHRGTISQTYKLVTLGAILEEQKPLVRSGWAHLSWVSITFFPCPIGLMHLTIAYLNHSKNYTSSSILFLSCLREEKY